MAEHTPRPMPEQRAGARRRWIDTPAIDGMPSLTYIERMLDILGETEYQAIPDYMLPSFFDYFFLGIRPGDFLQALLSNDLVGAVTTADDTNAAGLRQWCLFLENWTHSHCHGSQESMTSWLNHRRILTGDRLPSFPEPAYLPTDLDTITLTK